MVFGSGCEVVCLGLDATHQVRATDARIARIDDPTGCNEIDAAGLDPGNGREHADAAALRDDILSGRLAPGDPVDEVATAQEHEVSRTPVREALRQLADVLSALADSIAYGAPLPEARTVSAPSAARWAPPEIGASR